MPFQMRDETAGINIVYIDNAGQLGLGSLPNSGMALTVQGSNVISAAGNFGCGVLLAGSISGYEGAVFIPANSSSTVAIATAQLPTVTAGVNTSAVSTSQVVLNNAGGGDSTVQYAIW